MGVARWIGVLLMGVVAGATAVLALARVLAPAATDLGAMVAALAAAEPLIVGLAAGAPVVAALAAAAIAVTGPGAGVPAGAPAPVPAVPAGDEALTMLALLQQAGRFVDFVEEDLAPYSDAQIGAAVRSIHSGCRTVLRERLEISPILAGEEGAPVTIDAGFDPAAVRITGNVRGEPPYRGVLRHAGWRSTRPRLPERVAGRDPSILAPAEVEVA
jgi:hypothetical protein